MLTMCNVSLQPRATPNIVNWAVDQSGPRKSSQFRCGHRLFSSARTRASRSASERRKALFSWAFCKDSPTG